MTKCSVYILVSFNLFWYAPMFTFIWLACRCSPSVNKLGYRNTRLLIFQTSVDDNNNKLTVDHMMTFGDLVNFASIKTLYIECTPDTDESKSAHGVDNTKTRVAVDAFNLLMAGAKCNPKKKTDMYQFLWYSGIKKAIWPLFLLIIVIRKHFVGPKMYQFKTIK